MRLLYLVFLSPWLVLGGPSGICKGQDHQASVNEHVMKLVKAHESTIGLIHQFDAQFEIWNSIPADASAVLSGKSRWTRKDNLERVRTVDFVRHGGPDEVEKKLFADQFDDGKEVRVLKGWDPEHPVQLSPQYQNGVNAFLERHPLQQQTTRDPAPLLLLSFRDVTDSHELRLSLRQLVQRAKAVEVRGDIKREAGIDKDLICLRIWRDINKKEGGALSGRYFDVFLDPHVGMMARKLVNHHDQYTWPGGEKLPWAEWVHEVKAFHNVGDGVFFPTESELRVYRSDRKTPTAIIQIKPKTLTMNQSLPEDALDFRFPENAMVVLEEGGKRKVYLWGPNNEPVRTITSTTEVLEAQREFEKKHNIHNPRSRGYVVWFLYSSGVLLAITMVLLRIRFRRRHAKL